LYAGSHATSSQVDRVAVYSGATGTWTGIADHTYSNFIKLTLDDQQRLYVGSAGVLRRYDLSNQTWETLSTSFGGTINDLKFDHARGRVWLAISSSSNAVRYWDLATNTLKILPGNAGSSVQGLAFDHENVLYAAVQSPATFQGSVVRYDDLQESWTPIYNHQDTFGVLSIILDSLKKYLRSGKRGWIDGIYVPLCSR